MGSKKRVYCKIIFRDLISGKYKSIIGEIDKKQLLADDSNWITVHNTITTSKGLESSLSVVSKSEVREIIVFRPIKRIAFDKTTLMLNNTIKTS